MTAPGRPGRLAGALAVAAVCVALPFARSPADRAHPAPTAAFSAMGLSFRYPAAWHRGTWNDDPSNFYAPIVYLSNGPMHDPCTVTYSPGVKSVDCTAPVTAMPPGGVLVRWDADGFPAHHFPEPNTTVAGHPAIETTANDGWCASLGATETITVMIPRDTPDNWYQLDACLRAPNLPEQEAQVSAMLRTVHITPGDLRHGNTGHNYPRTPSGLVSGDVLLVWNTGPRRIASNW